MRKGLIQAGIAAFACATVTMTPALVAMAQDATPMGTPQAATSQMATPMAASGMTIDVPLLDAEDGVVGLATFTEAADGVSVTVLIEGLTPGEHGWHLHEMGRCDPNGEDAFSSAGPHWNPSDEEHGAPDAPSHHAGDFGNFTASADGLAEATLTTADFTLGEGPTSVFDDDGAAIIIHAGEDDLVTQPSGDSGARFACGVVAEPTMMMATPMAATPMAMGTPTAMGTPMAMGTPIS